MTNRLLTDEERVKIIDKCFSEDKDAVGIDNAFLQAQDTKTLKTVGEFLRKQGDFWADNNYAIIEAMEKGDM